MSLSRFRVAGHAQQPVQSHADSSSDHPAVM
jgi:hypothetical protein